MDRFFRVGLYMMCVICMLGGRLSAQNVSNVTATQVGKTIEVSYDLDKAADISLYLSTDGGKTFLHLQQVSGAVGKTVDPGHNTIVWNVTEVGELMGDDIVFKVKAGEVAANFITAPSTKPNDNPCPSTLTDYDGNIYNTVQIGQQCWMKENLRTTKYADGTSIALGSIPSTTIAYRYYPDNNSSNVNTYGYLYNWKAVMRNSSSSDANPSGVQGICPTGWHVPSDEEWKQLTNYVSSQSLYVCDGNNTYIAKALAFNAGWREHYHTGVVGNYQSSNNATGFSALPAGSFYGNYRYVGYFASFWSTTQTQEKKGYAYNRHIYYNEANVDRSSKLKSNGYSVRCLRD